jgi:hypothetical protein
MRIVLRALFLAGVIWGSVSAGTVQYQAVDLGQNAFRLTYSVSDFSFLENQELAIEFDPAVYQSLSDGVAPAGFDLLLLQPNNPLGAFGIFSALALVNDPVLSGIFSVDVVLTGSGRPGEQRFDINQWDDSGIFLSRVSSGVTVDATTTPEPATLPIAGVALLIGGVSPAVRRQFKSRV